MGVGVDRLAGYREAAVAGGGEPRLIAYGDFSEGSGGAAMRALLDRAPTSTRVFAASDLMAVGAMRALREAGRRVPEDVPIGDTP